MTALVEILAIGNELLAGDVLDTNSHWLCRQLAARGARVSRMATLPDDMATIGEALLAALSRYPALIVTCGGLGPTADDLTVAAQAAALGRALAEDPTAYAMVRDFYATLFRRGEVTTPDMTLARAKMAVLPADAEPLPNSVGAAPGVLMSEGETLIAALPGVPAEMKAIFEESLWPRDCRSIQRTGLRRARDPDQLLGRIDHGARGGCGRCAPSPRLRQVARTGLRRRASRFRYAIGARRHPV